MFVFIVDWLREVTFQYYSDCLKFSIYQLSSDRREIILLEVIGINWPCFIPVYIILYNSKIFPLEFYFWLNHCWFFTCLFVLHICNGYGAQSSISHILDCKNCGLVMICHNKLHDRVIHLSINALTTLQFCDNPHIHTVIDL